MEPDTIAAVASPPGPARRGVLRVSGPRAAALVAASARAQSGAVLPPSVRSAVRGAFDDGRGAQPLVLLWMPAPRSYTREDVAEFHLPGSPPLLAAGLERLIALGARPARPGEFTRRAFENGRIDLTQAAGVLALVEAENAAEARAAELLLAGGLARRVGEVRETLTELRALAEASLDFDERETGHVETAELLRLARAAREVLDELQAAGAVRAPRLAGPRVVLAGAPNAGKSTLFNALSRGPRALVSPLEGTTRDWLEAEWAVGGRTVRLVDTPGLWGGDEAAGEAQRLAAGERAAADLCLWVVDASAPADRSAPGAVSPETPAIAAWNKVDLAGAAAAPPAELLASMGRGRELEWVAISARTGFGLAELARRVAARVYRGGPSGASAAAELSARHAEALACARAELAQAEWLMSAGGTLDLFADLARRATDALDELTGRTTSDDVLERIFSRFCLGK